MIITITTCWKCGTGEVRPCTSKFLDSVLFGSDGHTDQATLVWIACENCNEPVYSDTRYNHFKNETVRLEK